MIMAGGKGERLHPLTRDRSKPAVPFAGRYRIVDFVLSNFVNSDMLSLYVLVQYKSQSLIEHVRLSWRTTGIVPDYFVTVVPPQMRFGPAWYRGTADAVLQNLNLIDDFNPDIVADRKSTRLNSSHGYISYAVFCLKKKKKIKIVYCSTQPVS